VNGLEARLAAEIRRRGPVPFSRLMEVALYDDDGGFYATGGAAGRRGDFITSPEVGPLFGAVVTRALDTWWRAAGEPDPYVVVEAGAGAGTLARAILAACPACAPSLRYVLVERSDALRARHSEHLALESAAFAFAPERADDDDDEDAPPTDRPDGPIVVSLGALPRVHANVVLANELLDNLPVDLVDGSCPVLVGYEEDRFVEVVVSDAGNDTGARRPIQAAAARWVRDARASADRVVVFDYASTTDAMAMRPWTEWLRTYRAHQRGTSPLEDIGAQDITCEVAVDQLPPPTNDTAQARWLRDHGIDALVADGKRIWTERAHIGDLEAMKARSRVAEAEALTDPNGLGAFRVLEWGG
jgi:SAM-dependent MidA family methyltransferase